MKVNFFDLKRQYAENQNQIEDKIVETVRECSYINGPEVKNFENNIKKYLNTENVISVNSGTDALIIALKSVGVKPGDEVITTPFTFFATAEAIARVVAIPVFVDVEEDTYNINPKLLEDAISEKTKAIIPVHLFGKSCDMEEIFRIARRNVLKVVNDACQAIGAEYKDKKIGSGEYSDVTAFSFYPTKNLGGIGDGGMITTNSEVFSTIAETLKNHAAGKQGAEARHYLGDEREKLILDEEQTELYDPYKYYNYMIGYNSRLDSIQAAVLNLKLQKLDYYNKKRNEIANTYIDGINEGELITLPKQSKSNYEVWHQFVLTTPYKEELIKYLGENGIGSGNFYPVPLHLQKAFDYLGYKEGDFPVAEKLAKSTVCLPIYPELEEKELEYVVDNVNEFAKVRKK